MRAEITAALADAKLPDLGAATETGSAGPTVDGQLAAEIARAALLIGKIPQGRPAGLDGGIQHLAHSFRQAPVTLLADAPGRRVRPDPGLKQGLAGIDVADPDHDAGIHEKVFDGHTTAAGTLKQHLAAELLAQGLGSQICQQGMPGRIRFGPEQGAEATRIVQPQAVAVGKDDIHVVMGAGGNVGRNHPYMAAHAQMQNQTAAFVEKQQVFSSPRNLPERAPDQNLVQLGRERPSQPGSA